MLDVPGVPAKSARAVPRLSRVVSLACLPPSLPRRIPHGLAALLLALLVLCSAIAVRGEKVEQLSPQGYVNDFAAVVDADSRQKLTALCQEVDQKANAQIAVVTIHSLEGDTAQNFGNRLFEKWGVGPKGKDRGVLILIAVDDHKYWTEVGYGLEPILPDGKVGGFGRDMLPVLRQGQYGAALLQMTSQVAAVIAQNANVTLSQGVPSPSLANPAPGQEPETFHGIPPGLVLPLIFLLFFGGWRLLAFLLIALGLMRPSRRSNYGAGGWWIGPMGGGGGGGSWGGGGGGFGGFGGGSSGGGGAGGSW
jgi:uncharacterized protein